ncbi:MAG: hypothetical protein AAF533_03100 [Acidobacteriota bacterium]
MTRVTDLKSLEVLDQKIKRAVDLVTRLKSENDELSEEVASWKGKVRDTAEQGAELEQFRVDHARLSDDHAALSEDHQSLSRKMSEMQSERKDLLDRVDGLISKLDTLPLD